MTIKEMFDAEGWEYDKDTPNLSITIYKKDKFDYTIVYNGKVYKISPIKQGGNIYCMIEPLFKYRLPIDVPRAINLIASCYRKNLILNVQNKQI